MRFLIETIPGDEHAMAIACVLEDRGHSVDLFYYADFPSRQSLTLAIAPGGTSVRVADQAGARSLGGYRAAVLRRRRSHVRSTDVHPADEAFVDQQCVAVSIGLAPAIPDVGFWVNPPHSLEAASNKPVQLCTARLVGLDVPGTIISNDPTEILAFVRAHDAIYKPLKPAAWIGGAEPVLTFTERVTEGDIERNLASLALAPGIFQQLVKKAFEVRVVMFGTFAVAVKIHTDLGTEHVIDWRSLYFSNGGLAVEPFEIPEPVRARCVELLKRLGLVFGCFDFCVDQDGRYQFLEVNQMGQFLWMDRATDVSVLDLFCQYLEGGRLEFEPTARRDGARFTEVSQRQRYIELLGQSFVHDSSGNDVFTYDESEAALP